ncbi:TetR family transcriptional regulator [Kutzneria viridogrisea]|uniref:AcrR family transcriptional regulator n=1 Tax=Kutzneria viridogrisea TaxID=47990 RepID=A0ABR6BD41_9PSEU|nr:AcrR family transcriptional regulator [Kutzneria viridogrisea]
MTEGLGLRERKKRETRAALSLAAIRLALQRGWENVSVEDIAEAANVSVRTFRNYFANKAEAVAATHFERMLRIGEDLCARPAEEPLWEAIANAVLPQFELGQAPPDPDRHAAVWRLLSEPAVQGEALKANAAAQVELAKAIAERTGTDVERELYPKLLAAAVTGAIAAATEHSLRAESPLPIGPLLREAFDQLKAGFPAR